MKVIKIFFKDCYVFSVDKFLDKRGEFSEIFNEITIKNNFKKKFHCKQINYVFSKKNTLRGIHLQKKPKSQMKIVRVIDGEILDVIVDLRKKSNSFGKYKKIILSSKNNRQIFVPCGFGHGYLTLSKTAKVIYFCSENYNKNSEVTIDVFDRDIKINWGNKKLPIISKKDSLGLSLKNFLKT